MDSEQGATSLLESVKAHVNERLKSPFGGAFVIAWVAINWDKLFVLAFSEKSAEVRAKHFAEQMTNTDGLWLPVAYAALGLISYYMLSGLAIALFESYGVFKRYVEQKFDNYRWVPPDQYIEWKRSSIKAIKDIQEIASDKLDKITRLEGELSSLGLYNKELLEKNAALESLEQTLKADLLKANGEATKARHAIERIRGIARDEAKKENEEVFNALLILADDLRMKLTRFQLLAKNDIWKGSADVIEAVFKSGIELVRAIEKHMNKRP